MLTPRQELLLSKVVAAHQASQQPVGSKALAADPDVEASSATIRNELAQLEEQGLLMHPHTSAGRVPTEAGYRYFVDHPAQPGRLDARRTEEVRSFFDSAHGALEQMLQDTSRLLSRLTDYAAVVVAPAHETAVLLDPHGRYLQHRGLWACHHRRGLRHDRTLEHDP